MSEERDMAGGAIEEEKWVRGKNRGWRADFEFSDADLDPNWEGDD